MADNFTVTRSTVVDAPASTVYAYIIDLHRWQEWSPWEGLDPALVREYTGAKSGVGARYAWRGNRKAGCGSMEIVAAEPTTGIDVAVAFEKPIKSTSTSSLRLAPEGAATRVTWTMVGPHSFFSRLAQPLGVFDRMLGKDFDKGLLRLKAISES